MKLYYYINTGHRIGLDRLRRSAPVINALNEMGVGTTLLTNDFRAGEYAKEQFGIGKYVSVDVVRNIANIATPQDALVFDSEEENRAMWEEMADYFRRFIRISDDPDDFISREAGLISSMAEGEGVLKTEIVDSCYFEGSAHTEENVYFWGDADYEQRLLELADVFTGLDVILLEGYYFFMQYGDELGKKFKRVEASEMYDEVLKSAKRFITSSPQSALEALAAGSNPIYLEKPQAKRSWRKRMESFGIPVSKSFSKDEISQKLSETLIYNEKRVEEGAAIEAALYIKDKLS